MKNTIHIHTEKVKFPTAPEFYGLFFEDINHAADGGLYPEMIRNRAFEDSLLPEGCTTDPDQRIFVTEYGWPGASIMEKAWMSGRLRYRILKSPDGMHRTPPFRF